MQINQFLTFRLQSCRSHIEILEGIHEFGEKRGERSERGDRAVLRVCGPSVREARDSSGRFLPRQAVISKAANMTILVRRAATQVQEDEEYLDGAFVFHDRMYRLLLEMFVDLNTYISRDISKGYNIVYRTTRRHCDARLCMCVNTLWSSCSDSWRSICAIKSPCILEY